MPGDLTRGMEKIRVSTCPGGFACGKENVWVSSSPAIICPREGKNEGLNMPGDLTHGKEKIRVSTCPATLPAGKEKGSQYARGLSPQQGEKRRVSTCPGL